MGKAASPPSGRRGERVGKAEALRYAITANRLADGRVVYLGADGAWQECLEAAALLPEREAAEAALAQARADEARAVVAPYVMAVRLTAGGPEPVALKDRLRATGPSVRAGEAYQ